MFEMNAEEEKKWIRQYHKKYVKSKNVAYLGPVECSKCGRHGYAYVIQQVNLNTGKKYPPSLTVRHLHTQTKPVIKTVYDGHCYIGVFKDEKLV
jgi:hypothetical protein